MEAAASPLKKRQKSASSERQAACLKSMNFARGGGGGVVVRVDVQRCVVIRLLGLEKPCPEPESRFFLFLTSLAAVALVGKS